MLGYTLILIAIRLSRTQVRHVLQMDGQVHMSRGSCSWVAKYTGPADLQTGRQVHRSSRLADGSPSTQVQQTCSWTVKYTCPADLAVGTSITQVQQVVG